MNIRTLQQVAGSFDQEPDMSFTYLTIRDAGFLIGLCKVRKITDRALEGHIMIDPEYWGTGITFQAAEEILKYLTNNSPYTKLVCQVPKACFHVINYVLKIGFTGAGVIKEGVTYNNEPTDLLIFERII